MDTFSLGQKLRNMLNLDDVFSKSDTAGASLIPQLDRGLFENLQLEQHDAWVAGGCALRWYQNLPVGEHDVDVWFSSAAAKDAMLASLMANKNFHRCNVIFTTENADTLECDINDRSYRVQLVKKSYEAITDLLESFDISVCKIATDGKSWILGENFAQDLKMRRLRVVSYHPKILRRVMKYWTYGFQPDDLVLQKIIQSDNIEWNFYQKETEDYDNAF